MGNKKFHRSVQKKRNKRAKAAILRSWKRYYSKSPHSAGQRIYQELNSLIEVYRSTKCGNKYMQLTNMIRTMRQRLKEVKMEEETSPGSTLFKNRVKTYSKKSPLAESKLSSNYLEIFEPQIKIEKIEVEEETLQESLNNNSTVNIEYHESHVNLSQNLVLIKSDYKAACIKEETELVTDNIKVDLELDETGIRDVCKDEKNFEFIVADQEHRNYDEITDDVPFLPLPSIPQEENVQDPLEINYCNTNIQENRLRHLQTINSCSNNESTKTTLTLLSDFFKTKKKLSLDDLDKYCIEKNYKVKIFKANTSNFRRQLKKNDTNLCKVKRGVKENRNELYEQLQSLYFYNTPPLSPENIEVSDKTNETLSKHEEKSIQPTITPREVSDLPTVPEEFSKKKLKPILPAPILMGGRTSNEIEIIWNMNYNNLKNFEEVASYEIFGHTRNERKIPGKWNKLCEKAAIDPMKCTFKNVDDVKYYFVVRGVDIYKRPGKFSNKIVVFAENWQATVK